MSFVPTTNSPHVVPFAAVQGNSCVLAVNSNAFAGELPPRLEAATTPGAVGQDATAAAVRYARQFATNVHPDAAASLAKSAPKAPGLEIQVDAATGTWLAPHIALLGLKTGQLVLVQLTFKGSAASKIQVREINTLSSLPLTATCHQQTVYAASLHSCHVAPSIKLTCVAAAAATPWGHVNYEHLGGKCSHGSAHTCLYAHIHPQEQPHTMLCVTHPATSSVLLSHCPQQHTAIHVSSTRLWLSTLHIISVYVKTI